MKCSLAHLLGRDMWVLDPPEQTLLWCFLIVQSCRPAATMPQQMSVPGAGERLASHDTHILAGTQTCT